VDLAEVVEHALDVRLHPSVNGVCQPVPVSQGDGTVVCGDAVERLVALLRVRDGRHRDSVPDEGKRLELPRGVQRVATVKRRGLSV
jgi:hypothetical protein